MPKRPRAIYVLNAFSGGGAEIGLATLLEHGLLKSTDLKIFVFARGDEHLRRRVADRVGEKNVWEATSGPRLSMKNFFQGSFALWRLLRSFKPQVVILSLKQANIVARFLLLFQPSVRCIAFEHIARLERGSMVRLYEALLTLLSVRVDEVWADCETTLRGARRYYPWNTPVQRVVPLFVASDAPRKADYRICGAVKLVMAGRLVPRKNVDIAIEALALLRARGIDAFLTIYGAGPSRQSLSEQAGKAGLSDKVRFAGFQERWWCRAIDHDLFLQLSAEEGFCIAAAEAMMVGLPIIATPVGGLKDYAFDAHTALHVPVADAEAVARAIIHLFADEGRRRRLGSAASGHIRQAYSAQCAQAAYCEIERQLFAQVLPIEPQAATPIKRTECREAGGFDA